MDAGAEILARSLAALLLAVRSRKTSELQPACDEAKRVLFRYLEASSAEIRQQRPKWMRESPYWQP